jgi:hypothetical protein
MGRTKLTPITRAANLNAENKYNPQNKHLMQKLRALQIAAAKKTVGPEELQVAWTTFVWFNDDMDVDMVSFLWALIEKRSGKPQTETTRRLLRARSPYWAGTLGRVIGGSYVHPLTKATDRTTQFLKRHVGMVTDERLQSYVFLMHCCLRSSHFAEFAAGHNLWVTGQVTWMNLDQVVSAYAASQNKGASKRLCSYVGKPNTDTGKYTVGAVLLSISAQRSKTEELPLFSDPDFIEKAIRWMKKPDTLWWCHHLMATHIAGSWLEVRGAAVTAGARAKLDAFFTEQVLGQMGTSTKMAQTLEADSTHRPALHTYGDRAEIRAGRGS